MSAAVTEKSGPTTGVIRRRAVGGFTWDKRRPLGKPGYNGCLRAVGIEHPVVFVHRGCLGCTGVDAVKGEGSTKVCLELLPCLSFLRLGDQTDGKEFPARAHGGLHQVASALGCTVAHRVKRYKLVDYIWSSHRGAAFFIGI